jgi:hypothetical protein
MHSSCMVKDAYQFVDHVDTTSITAEFCSSCLMIDIVCVALYGIQQVTVEAIACAESAVAQGSSTAWQQVFLEALPPIHQNTFLYLTAFFRCANLLLCI